MNKITCLQELSKQKMKYIRNIPLNRRENMKNIYVKLSRGITDAFDRLNQATLLMKNSEFKL